MISQVWNVANTSYREVTAKLLLVLDICKDEEWISCYYFNEKLNRIYVMAQSKIIVTMSFEILNNSTAFHEGARHQGRPCASELELSS